MRMSRPTLPATLLGRYKRFLADVRLASGEVITVHCPNSGAMTGCDGPGSPVIISDSQSASRKLRYTWELVDVGDTWVGVNTGTPNAAVHYFIGAGRFPELTGYDEARREVRYGVDGTSRIDILLTGPRGTCHVEIKNATLRVGEHAAFPDAVTTRGQKHLRELTALATRGERAVMFYFMGRSDCRRFRAADEVDPAYGALLRQAEAAGVELLAYRMHYTPEGVEVLERAPVDLV
jgi:sugar fermentation stimulation protein A